MTIFILVFAVIISCTITGAVVHDHYKQKEEVKPPEVITYPPKDKGRYKYKIKYELAVPVTNFDEDTGYVRMIGSNRWTPKPYYIKADYIGEAERKFRHYNSKELKYRSCTILSIKQVAADY